MELLANLMNNSVDSRLPSGDMSGIRLVDVKWSVKTAGPSPDNNQRVELFLKGCRKAINGYACKGCFNRKTWNSIVKWTHDPVKMAEHINNVAKNKYISIGGGEPLDQIDNLIILCRELKKYGFHILVYTWRNRDFMLSSTYTLRLRAMAENDTHVSPAYNDFDIDKQRAFMMLEQTIDILVDGEYKEEERLWDGTKEDGLISSIGSGNQGIVDCSTGVKTLMRDIDSLSLDKENNLIIKKKEGKTNYDINK